MLKRLFDIFMALTGLLLVGWLIVLFWVLLTAFGRKNGLFLQTRIGRFGKPFTIYKLRTLFRDRENATFTTNLGSFLRKTKIDELPQLWNVLIGQMSIVGPRPDIAGYYDKLEGEARKVLELRPGLTSPASLKYYNEESLLQTIENPEEYNDSVLFPDKVKMNLEYYYNRSFWGDIKIIWNTIFRI